MKNYSAIFRRLNGLEEIEQYGSPMVIRQHMADVDEWEMWCSTSPYYGQVRTLKEWEDIAERDRAISLILLSAKGGIYVEPAGNLAEFDG